MENRRLSKSGKGTSLTLADPPVITRSRQLLSGMIESFRENGDPQYTKYLWMLEAFASEGIEQMRDAAALGDGAAEAMQQWFMEISMLFEWVGTGVVRGDLPDWMQKLQPKELEQAEEQPIALD